MKIWHEVWDYIKMIIIVVAIVLVINNVVLINAKIPSPSMEKTIMTGDRIFGFRLAYGINLDLFGHEISKKVKDPERFDIVIFKYPDDESQLFIKRVIGPGNRSFPATGSSLWLPVFLQPDLHCLTAHRSGQETLFRTAVKNTPGTAWKRVSETVWYTE